MSSSGLTDGWMASPLSQGTLALMSPHQDFCLAISSPSCSSPPSLWAKRFCFCPSLRNEGITAFPLRLIPSALLFLPTFASPTKLFPKIRDDSCTHFILKVHIPAIDQLDRLLDCFLLYGSTTTSLIQSSPVPLRPPPLPEDSLLE